uniref:Uncharacterized protein n=1 Tax=Amphilophus citrinellus TaxID=61819 RepID=A0A3Q0RQP3_AMPCI
DTGSYSRRAGQSRRRSLTHQQDWYLLLCARRIRMSTATGVTKQSETDFMRWWDVIVPAFTNAQWVQNFRMSREVFHSLCNKLRPAMERRDTTSRECVPVRKRVAIALWKLATGSDCRSIGHLFGVSNTTVCRCVQVFCAAAETLLVPKQIRYPDEGRFREMADYTENRWGNRWGAIDGSHIPIIIYWVLRLSTLWKLATRGNLFPANVRSTSAMTAGYYILGDSAYPLQQWLLKPFQDTGHLTAEQHIFNQHVSCTRVVVENAFGRLRGRWCCLLKRNDCDIQLVKSMVATCALHNLCETYGETYETSWDVPIASALQPVVALAHGDGGGAEMYEKR